MHGLTERYLSFTYPFLLVDVPGRPVCWSGGAMRRPRRAVSRLGWLAPRRLPGGRGRGFSRLAGAAERHRHRPGRLWAGSLLYITRFRGSAEYNLRSRLCCWEIGFPIKAHVLFQLMRIPKIKQSHAHAHKSKHYFFLACVFLLLRLLASSLGLQIFQLTFMLC